MDADKAFDSGGRELSDADLERAVWELSKAGLVTDDTDDEVRSLLIKAWAISGGLPSRYAGVPEQAPQIPDLTATDKGMRLLAKIEKQGQAGSRWRRS